MQRVLAGLIVVCLAGAISVAIVKDDDTEPLVQGTPSPSPSQTFTFPGVPPTVPNETPIIPPTEEPSPTETPDKLANTGNGAAMSLGGMMLGLALLAGLAVRRAARGTR